MPGTILTDENFDNEVLSSKVPVLVDFWAPWCGPCKMQSPILEQLADDYKDKKVKIAKLNVDEASRSASKYQVMSIPTLILFKDGKPVDQMIGVQDKDALIEKLNKAIN
ncbi:MAG: thioredoxin [Parcubacteria group bacterium]|jgi:thioredoxin 1|nr:thioredoxin [Parcubacteria group bacterium]|tara:strand:+ start:2133 stop:2459 length:327 start_codon:yes stop_codon:yes gene_type:complete